MFSMAFRSNVIVYDPYLSDKARTMWTDTLGADRVTVASELEGLLSQADIVSLHVPLTSGTRNLISARELSLMKSSAILINSSRGGIVNEADLATALEQGQIFGAGLDAFDSEPHQGKSMNVSASWTMWS
jgi:(S)-sulfolactate dehydrogenase